ncbi:MAG: TraB/GumN family protein [Bacteroidales bacterium]|nr:TraB/GumN family protein [Bacteroidales bacterium]
MKKIFIIPILVFFVSLTFAQTGTEKTGSLLWKISGNGLTQPSYIFGTHHLFPLSFLDNVAGLKEAFASSKQVVGELVIQDMPTMQAEIQRKSMMPSDTTWQMLFSEDDYRFVDAQLTVFLGVGLQALGAFKPFMVSMIFTVTLYQAIFPEVNPNESMDSWFQQQAIGKGLPVLGLETIQDQVNAIGVGSLKQQATDLVCVMRNIEFVQLSARRLNDLYQSADLTGIAELLREESPNPCPSNAELEYALNNARNKRWLKKLPAIMADKPSFIAVGALHLAGEAGILYGLQQAGYTVEAVR